MAETFVKKIGDLLNVVDEWGTGADDKYVVQSENDNSAYHITLAQLRNAIALSSNYSSGGLYAGSSIVITGLYDGALYAQTIQAVKEVASPMASFLMLAEQSIPDSTWTAVEWAEPHSYSGNLADWWDSSGKTQIKFNGATTGACYLITGIAKFESDATGTRGVRINQSNATPEVADAYLECYMDAASSNSTFVPFSFSVPENDNSRHFTFEVYQNSGGALPLFEGSTAITIWKVK